MPRKPSVSTKINTPAAHDQRVTRQFKALGHPVRLRIFQELAAHESYCGDLVELTGLAQSTVSHHLKILKTAELITSRDEGTSTCYGLNPDGLATLREWLQGLPHTD